MPMYLLVDSTVAPRCYSVYFPFTGNTTDAKLCPSPSPPPRYVNHTSRPPLLEIIIGLVLVAITLAVGGVIVCILVLKYLQRKNHDSLQLLEPLYGKSDCLVTKLFQDEI